MADLSFDAERMARAEDYLARYPFKKAALLMVLRLAEEQWGAITPEICAYVAGLCECSPAHVWGVVTFYTHFKREHHGKHRIMFCHTLPCALAGCAELLGHVEKKLGIKCGQTTPDGKFSIEKVECIAACDKGPAMQIDGAHYESLTAEQVDAILEGLK